MIKIRARTRLHVLSVSFAASLALVLAGCGSDAEGSSAEPDADAGAITIGDLGVAPETADYIQELYEAALEESGTLVLYGTNHENMKHLYKVFEETFPGLTVETYQQTSAEQIAILEAERASGNYVADILQNPNGLRYIEQGFTEPYEPRAFASLDGFAPEVLANLHDEEFMYTTPQFTLFGIGINTDLISAEEAPGSWEEFAEEQWAGKIVLHDPTVPGGGQAIMERLLQSGTVDEAWLEEVAANVSLKGDYAGSVMSLVQGEFPVLLAGAGSDLENKKSDGAPVEFLFAEKNNIGLADKWMVLEGSPNPSTGRLFLNFLYTQPGQQAIADTSNLPIRDDVTSPHGWPSFTDAKLAVLPSEAELQKGREKVVATLTEKFRN